MKNNLFTRVHGWPMAATWLLIASTVLLSGCATGPQFRAVESMPDGKSAVYFYRPARFYGGARSPSIYDNGEKIVDGVTNGGYTVYFVKPGEHVFSSKAAILSESSVRMNSKAPGEEYYIRMDILAGAMKSDVKLYRVYPEQGREEIVDCKLIE